jgi:hypothetical protein
MSPYSVDDIRDAVRQGLLDYDDAVAALERLGVHNPARLLWHPVHVAPSPTLPARVDQFGRGQTFVDQWGRTGQR